jgi:predicted dehydrogenase
LEGNYITQELEYYKHNMEKVHEGFSNFVIRMGEPQKETIKVDFEEPLAAELKAFYSKIQGNNVHLVDPVAAREALKLALQAMEPMNK